MTHEYSLLADLLRKIEEISRTHGRRRVASVTLRLGALAGISPGHLREHFEHAALGTVAAGAQLHILTSEEVGSRHALDLVLDSVELEE